VKFCEALRHACAGVAISDSKAGRSLALPHPARPKSVSLLSCVSSAPRRPVTAKIGFSQNRQFRALCVQHFIASRFSKRGRVVPIPQDRRLTSMRGCRVANSKARLRHHHVRPSPILRPVGDHRSLRISPGHRLLRIMRSSGEPRRDFSAAPTSLLRAAGNGWQIAIDIIYLKVSRRSVRKG
jgi:hypothetical protein